jgi:hypothetical protein
MHPVQFFMAAIYWVGDARRSHKCWNMLLLQIVYLVFRQRLCLLYASLDENPLSIVSVSAIT